MADTTSSSDADDFSSLCRRDTSSTSASVTTSTQAGPKSGTEWFATSSSSFAILGKGTASTNNSSIVSYRSPATSLRGLVVTTDEPICSLHIVLSTESNGGGSGGGGSMTTTTTTTDATNGSGNVDHQTSTGGESTTTTAAAGGAWHHPDDGLPHTLEHLVFLGSQTHPHKGVLDKLANRSMANGTNAWTATDHTAYTLSTAGSEGVINLMPIFADHVLFPTLTDSGFITEVHHVNGKGENKGVVYCEMQGRENSEGSLVDRAIMSLLYPDHTPTTTSTSSALEQSPPPLSCGYSAETGGKMANLRSLSVDKVRRYHKEYYTPDNIILIVTGNVSSSDYFVALDDVEALILKRQLEKEMTMDCGVGSSGNNGIGSNGGGGGGGGGDGVGGGLSTSSRVGRPWMNSFVPPMVSNGKVGVYPPYNHEEWSGGGGSGSGSTSQPLIIPFPSEDESRGTISIAWRGPKYSSRSAWVQLSLLWEYLTDSAASPLQLAFVENDDPLCADIGPAHDVFTEGYHQLWFQEVDVDAMEEVVPLFYEVIAKQAGLAVPTADDDMEDQQGGEGGGFDLASMHTVIRRYRRRLLEASERRPTSAIVDGIVRNFLYGPRVGEPSTFRENGSVTSAVEEMEALHLDVDILPFLDEAEGLCQDATHWQNLLKTYMLDRPMAVVFGKPSAALSKGIQNSEKEREAQQGKDLGVEGLERLAKILEAAMEENEHPIPGDILTSLPVPDLEKVPSIPLFTARLYPTSTELSLAIVPESIRDVGWEESEAIIARLKGDSTLTAVPFHADLTNIDSAFVFAAVGIDTTPLSKEQRLYLPILNEILFKLPATLEDGSQLSKDQFVNSIHDETVSYSNGVGLLGGAIPQMSYISAQVETNDGSGLATALRWIRRALYLTNITTDSVKTAVQRLISEISPQIRSGPTVVATVAAELNYNAEKSNTLACNLFRQKPFLSKVYEAIESDNGAALQDVVEELDGIRNKLFQTSNYHAFVAANLKVIPKLLDTLVVSLTRSDEAKIDSVGRAIDNVSASSVLRARGDGLPGGDGAVCALSAIESGFLNITAPGIKAYDENHASLLVAIEYLTALEGVFWVKLRGAGLTYSYSISESTDSQLLRFSLFKCTDIVAAFETASNIIAEYAKGNVAVSAIGLENAKSTLAYQIISGRCSKLSAAASSFVRTFKGERMDYDRYLLSRISEVTSVDVMHALVTHLVPIFDTSSKLAIACPTNKLDQVHDYFTKRGWTNLKKVPEEKLFSAFVDTDDAETHVLPDKVPGMSMFLPGAFAAQFRCACPKCDR